ncbi:SDR family NAD(P)-dependent oxidoreductase [Schlesneria sp. DSM 10557]|uniref:SDR family NAD(P)-dependent oxidoreductase n=1 Tax=Schlesneria sp. DSM 10557 TaxID=3044399 RepID=UPI00359FE789
MSKKLEGKVAVITGGCTELGVAAARKFVSEGADVFITGRSHAEFDTPVMQIGRHAAPVQGDIDKFADLGRLYETVRSKKGRIDILFANAGYSERDNYGSATEVHFHKLFGINVRRLLISVQKALPLLNDGASIILTSSVAGVTGFDNIGAYNATKAAVSAFAKTWTSSLKLKNIRVNVINPAPIVPPLFGNRTQGAFAEGITFDRISDPEEIADAAVYLAQNESRFLAGIDLFVDAGLVQV